MLRTWEVWSLSHHTAIFSFYDLLVKCFDGNCEFLFGNLQFCWGMERSAPYGQNAGLSIIIFVSQPEVSSSVKQTLWQLWTVCTLPSVFQFIIAPKQPILIPCGIRSILRSGSHLNLVLSAELRGKCFFILPLVQWFTVKSLLKCTTTTAKFVLSSFTHSLSTLLLLPSLFFCHLLSSCAHPPISPLPLPVDTTEIHKEPLEMCVDFTRPDHTDSTSCSSSPQSVPKQEAKSYYLGLPSKPVLV